MKTNGVIAAGHRLTAEAGASVLRDGGTAVDAAIAALAMACVCEPVLCAPGGGGFALVRDGRSGDHSVIDFFPQTPLARLDVGDDSIREVVADFGTATQAFHIGPGTTATPGFSHGLHALHAAGASAPMTDLFTAATGAARDGVTITPFQHHLATVVRPILTATRGAADLFAPGGELVPIGDIFRNPGLADALETLAVTGISGSPLGAATIALQAGRGHVTAADLREYRAIERTPLSLRLGEAIVHMNPLPAAGGTLIGHTLAQLRSVEPLATALALQATGAARRAASGELSALSPATLRQRGTTHISAIDADGTACAVTMSNGEGNGELVDGYGFMLNNVLGEEDVNSFGPTRWPVATRLSSMMCPTIVEMPDGQVVALGSGGSNRIRSAICQVVARLCIDDADLRAAVEAPRLHVEGDHLDFEDHFDDDVRTALCRAFPNHRAWPRPDLFYGGVHAVRRAADVGCLGVGDARRDGVAITV